MSRTMPVVWHPNTVKTSVARLAAIVQDETFNPDDVYRIAGSPILGSDLMCLVDIGRTHLTEGGA